MLIWLTTSFVAKVFSPLVLRIKRIVGRLPLSPISVERLHVLLCRFPARQKCFLVGGAPRVDNAPERRGMAQELEWTSQLRGRGTKGSCCQWSERTSPVHGWPSDGDVSPVAGSLKGDTSSAQTMRATLIHRPRSANGSPGQAATCGRRSTVFYKAPSAVAVAYLCAPIQTQFLRRSLRYRHRASGVLGGTCRARRTCWGHVRWSCERAKSAMSIMLSHRYGAPGRSKQ